MGIDVKAYPYKDVKVGKRFAYAADLANDPYPDEHDVISEETWNLPAVQRFSAAKTYREKLAVFNDLRDELTQEDFLEELRRGNFIFEDKIFEQVVFEDISCKNLIFRKCHFRDVQFMKNRIERLELNDCVLSDSIFTGKWENTLLILHKNYFRSCKIHDLEVPEASGASEMTGCQFSNCEFSEIKIVLSQIGVSHCDTPFFMVYC